MSAAPANELQQAFRRAVVIYTLLIASLLLYASVVELIKVEFAPFEGYFPFPPTDILRYILVVLAVANFFFIRYVRGNVLSGKHSVKAMLYQRKPFSEPLQRLYVSATIAFHLCIAVAIYGLVLFLAAGNTLDYYLFAALSLILFAVNLPRYHLWERWIDRQSQ